MPDELLPPDPADDGKPRRRGRGSVVALTKPDLPVVQEVIDTLEELLAMARKGEVAELICIYANAGGETGYNQTEIAFIPAICGELQIRGDALSEAYRDE